MLIYVKKMPFPVTFVYTKQVLVFVTESSSGVYDSCLFFCIYCDGNFEQ